jgi:hypothetical protein
VNEGKPPFEDALIRGRIKAGVQMIKAGATAGEASVNLPL